MRKKDRCAVLGCNNDRLFPEKYTLSSLFARKARVHTERVLPGTLIIVLKSSKFSVAAVWVKRSIEVSGKLTPHRCQSVKKLVEIEAPIDGLLPSTPPLGQH